VLSRCGGELASGKPIEEQLRTSSTSTGVTSGRAGQVGHDGCSPKRLITGRGIGTVARWRFSIEEGVVVAGGSLGSSLQDERGTRFVRRSTNGENSGSGPMLTEAMTDAAT
jgi:hypothetical protein